MYFKVQDFRSDLWVEDHPSEPGCYIWPEGQSPPKLDNQSTPRRSRTEYVETR